MGGSGLSFLAGESAVGVDVPGESTTGVDVPGRSTVGVSRGTPVSLETKKQTVRRI